MRRFCDAKFIRRLLKRFAAFTRDQDSGPGDSTQVLTPLSSVLKNLNS
jgi:hypothetical protein